MIDRFWNIGGFNGRFELNRGGFNHHITITFLHRYERNVVESVKKHIRRKLAIENANLFRVRVVLANTTDFSSFGILRHESDNSLCFV